MLYVRSLVLSGHFFIRMKVYGLEQDWPSKSHPLGSRVSVEEIRLSSILWGMPFKNTWQHTEDVWRLPLDFQLSAMDKLLD